VGLVGGWVGRGQSGMQDVCSVGLQNAAVQPSLNQYGGPAICMCREKTTAAIDRSRTTRQINIDDINIYA
jgi:hypothetical protein